MSNYVLRLKESDSSDARDLDADAETFEGACQEARSLAAKTYIGGRVGVHVGGGLVDAEPSALFVRTGDGVEEREP